MARRIVSLAQNLALSGLALALVLLVLEFGVFRTILVPDDLLENVSIDGIVRYKPNTRAIFRHPDGRQSLVSINADGWNSPKPAYRAAKPPGTLRIAVIGDSYVHGAFVNVGLGFPEVIEKELGQRGVRAEVLRFGMDGAPLSQYLNMLRTIAPKYHPDVVVVQLIHNDFDESYRFMRTRYTSSFMKIGENARGELSEIAPTPFQPGIADLMRRSALFRYMYYETGLYLELKKYVSRYFWGGNEEWRPEFISSAVDIRNLDEPDKITRVTRYVIRKMKRVARENGVKLVFAMDGVREAIYARRPTGDFKVGELNRIAARIVGEEGLPFLDLQETFAIHYNRYHERFEYPYDWHWNVLANRLVGKAITRFLLSSGTVAKRLAEAGDVVNSE